MAGKPKTREKIAKLEAIGIDGVCERILAGESQASIARSIDMYPSQLHAWLEADTERSTRARAARMLSADSYADKAEQVLLDASDPFEITKARELAQHYRWMAKVRKPAEYGDRQQIDQNVKVDLTVEQVDMRLARLLEKASG